MIDRADIVALAERISREFAPERIILFGSCAYGTPTEGAHEETGNHTVGSSNVFADAGLPAADERLARQAHAPRHATYPGARSERPGSSRPDRRAAAAHLAPAARAPKQLLDLIELKGREITAALSVLRRAR